MKEWQKEWLGIKPADLMIYAGFFCLVPMYFIQHTIVDIVFATLGLGLCFISIYFGSKPHPDLNKITNFIKLVSYPLCTLLFIYLAYLNFSAW